MKGDAGRLAKRVAPARQSHLRYLVLCVPARSQLHWRSPMLPRERSSVTRSKSVVCPVRSVGGGYGYVFSVGNMKSDTLNEVDVLEVAVEEWTRST
jgi:hypothetical protein